jgi:hypothetical protein
MRRCGDRSFFCLVKLWGWVAQYKPEGDLSGMDDESIEIAAGWTGDEGAFVGQLSAVGFLDGESGSYKLHDWEEHNPWAAGANARSEAASKAGKASAAKRAEKTGVKSTDSNGASTERQRSFNERSTDSNGASTPSPSPSPSPNTTPPPSAHAREADQSTPDQTAPPYSMTPDWQPSEFFPPLAETAGFKPPPLDELEPALREFRAYWLTQNRMRTAHEWDLAFIKALRNGFAAPRGKPKNNKNFDRKQTLSPRQKYMEDVGNLLEAMDATANNGRTTSIGQIAQPLPGVGPQLEHAGKAGL